MTRSQKPASLVRNKLREIAAQRLEPYQLVLERYALERFLYRLGQTSHGPNFLLKGGLLLTILAENFTRPTRDMDLLGYGNPSPEHLTLIFLEAAALSFPEDGMRYDKQLEISRIKEGQEYEGVRMKLKAWLSDAEVTLKMDIGFGDAVLQPCEQAPFKPIMSLPAPVIHAYPLESVMAEKLHAMVSLGINTSRMKDIYDLNYLANLRPWSALRVAEAVQLTFTRRYTSIPIELPVMFTSVFFENSDKLAQWRAFQKKSSPDALELKPVLSQLESFWWPLLQSLTNGKIADVFWNPNAWNWQAFQ